MDDDDVVSVGADEGLQRQLLLDDRTVGRERSAAARHSAGRRIDRGAEHVENGRIGIDHDVGRFRFGAGGCPEQGGMQLASRGFLQQSDGVNGDVEVRCGGAGVDDQVVTGDLREPVDAGSNRTSPASRSTTQGPSAGIVRAYRPMAWTGASDAMERSAARRISGSSWLEATSTVGRVAVSSRAVISSSAATWWGTDVPDSNTSHPRISSQPVMIVRTGLFGPPSESRWVTISMSGRSTAARSGATPAPRQRRSHQG